MDHKMIRKNRELSQEETVNILEKSEYGILSTVGIDNQPYGVPLNFVYKDNCIYFHCAMIGHKLENIKNNNLVSFTVVGNTKPKMEEEYHNFTTEYESTIVFGKVVEVVQEQEKISSLKDLCEKYLSEHMHLFEKAVEKSIKGTKIYKVEIEKMSGKAKK